MFSVNTKRAVLLGFLVFTASFLITRPEAASADGTRYPASLCRQWAGPAGSLYFSSFVAPGLPAQSTPQENGGSCPPGQAGGCPPCAGLPACENDPAYSIRVDCPIPKSFPDYGVQDVTVDVIDRHNVLNVQCWLTSTLWNNASNNFQQNSTSLSTTGSGNNIQPLDFHQWSSEGPGSHWYISCSIPANSAIVSYYVWEASAPLPVKKP